MVDQKITALTADTAPTTDDLVVTVNDPSGTPANKKVTVGNLLSANLFTNPYKFSVYQTSNQTVGTAATLINFDTAEYDTGSNFSLVNDVFTAPIAGFYHFTFTCTWSANVSATAYILSIRLTPGATTNLIRGADIRGTNITGAQTISGTVQLSANDTVGAYVDTGGHSVATAAAQSQVRFQGFLVSAT